MTRFLPGELLSSILFIGDIVAEEEQQQGKATGSGEELGFQRKQGVQRCRGRWRRFPGSQGGVYWQRRRPGTNASPPLFFYAGTLLIVVTGS